MKTFIVYLTLMLSGAAIGMSAELTKKETAEPCMQALEEIAEAVNDKIYPE